MSERGRLWLWRGAAVAWMLLVYFLSSQSSLPSTASLPDWVPADKVAHFVMFGVLAALLYLGGVSAPLAIAVTGLYGAVDEFHQFFVPGRDSSIWDWVADVSGAALAVWLVRFSIRRGRTTRRSLE